jgi:hypothetical protein
MIVAFVGFSRIYLLAILIFKGLTARRLYKSFGVKGLTALRPNSKTKRNHEICLTYFSDMCVRVCVCVFVHLPTIPLPM